MYLPEWRAVGEGDPAGWWRTWEVNVDGSYLACRYLLPPPPLESELKTVINISMNDLQLPWYWYDSKCTARELTITRSAGGVVVRPTASAYQSTKLAIWRFTEFLAAEDGERGLVAYALHPGGVKTELAYDMPKWMHSVLVDEPELPADTMVWLCNERRVWLSGRLTSACWNLEEVVARKDEIAEKNLFKFAMTV